MERRYRRSSSSRVLNNTLWIKTRHRDDLFSRSKCLLMLKASVWPSYGAGNKRSIIIEDNHKTTFQRRLRLIPTTKIKRLSKKRRRFRRRRKRNNNNQKKRTKSLVVLFEINKRRSRVPAQEEEEVLFFVHKSARIFNLPVPFGLDSDKRSRPSSSSNASHRKTYIFTELYKTEEIKRK